MWPEEYLNYDDEEGVYWFSSPYEALNNWSAHAITAWGKEFKTLEHAYHYAKFMETDPETAERILNSGSPIQAKKITREDGITCREDWGEVRVDVMTELARLKFEQHEDVQEVLRRTGNRIIYENSPVDSFWGIGKDKKGKNMMGKIWMQIRDE